MATDGAVEERLALAACAQTFPLPMTHARGPHMPSLDWRLCANAFVRSAPPDNAASLLDAVGVGYRAILGSSDFEQSALLKARVRAMQQLYADRKSGSNAHSTVEDRLIAQLRRALAKGRLGPAATSLGERLIDIVDIEHGL